MNLKKLLLPSVIGATMVGTAAVSSASTATLDGNGTWHPRVSLNAQAGVADSANISYTVYTPQGYDGSTELPLVVAVHGCVTPEGDVEAQWDLELHADANNFIVLAPNNRNSFSSGTTFRSQDCWGYWFDQHQVRGSGEPADIINVVDQVKSNYSVDNERVFVTGLSSGGMMTTILATTYPDVFAAAASFAGGAYDTAAETVTSETGYQTPQWHANAYLANRGTSRDVHILFGANNNDTVVTTRDSLCLGPVSMAIAFGYSSATDSCSSNGVATSGTTIDSGSEEGVSWTLREWAQEGSATVQVYNYNGSSSAGSGSLGSGHFWVSDDDTGEYTHNIGRAYMDVAWDFFKDKTLSGNQKPVISLVGDAQDVVVAGTSWTDPGATATDHEDGDITSNIVVSGSVNTNAIGDYTLTYTITDSGDKSASVERTVLVRDGATNTSPVITLTDGSSVTVSSGDTWVEPGYSAADEEDGNLTSSVVIGGDTVNTAVEGDYQVTYTVSDNGTQLDGNTGSTQSTTVTRTVTVVPKCWTTPVSEHMTAGRAATSGGYVCQTIGGGDQLSEYTYTCEYLRDYDSDPTYSIMETSPGTFNKVESCNAPVTNNDADGDGVSDANDQCPNTPAGDTVDATGCTITQPTDSDGDGVDDANDQCPNTPAGATVDANGCEVTTGSCEEHTTANYYHKTAGRAYSSGNYFSPDYFANGTDDAMAGSTWGQTTLSSEDGTNWSVGACP